MTEETFDRACCLKDDLLPSIDILIKYLNNKAVTIGDALYYLNTKDSIFNKQFHQLLTDTYKRLHDEFDKL